MFAGVEPSGMTGSRVRRQKSLENAYFLWFSGLFGRMRMFRTYRCGIFNIIPEGVKHEEPLYYDHDH